MRSRETGGESECQFRMGYAWPRSTKGEQFVSRLLNSHFLLGFLGTTGDALGVVFEDGLFNIYDVETQNKKPARSRFGKG